MRAPWVTFLFLEAAFATYLKDGCIVRGNLESKVELGHSLQISLRFPLERDFRVFLPYQNVSLTRNELRMEPDTLEGWLQVELFFYKKLELRDSDGRVILSGADEIEVQPPPQLIEITNARVLDNCPEKVPVWKMYRDKPRIFPLKERNSFVISFKTLPLFFQLIINSQVWNLTCTENQNCFTKTSDSAKMSIIKDDDHFKVLIDDHHFGTAPSTRNDKVYFELKSGSFYLALPEEQESEATTNDSSTRVLLSVLGLISACLVLSLVLNAAFTCHLRNKVCGLGKSTQNNNMHDDSVVEEQMPATPNEGHEGGTHQESYHLPINQHLPPREVQNATIMPSTVRDSDYILPNDVKPFEVEILKKANFIKGQVFISEVGQGKKHVPQGDYLDLTEVNQEITNNWEDESLYMNVDRDNEEPDYMNVPKRL